MAREAHLGIAVSTDSPSTAAGFGATVSTAARESSLFLVVGREGPPDTIVRSVGGSVVSRLNDRRLLAIAPLAAHTALRQNRDIELAGPVTVDPGRFERFARLIGLTNRNRFKIGDDP